MLFFLGTSRRLARLDSRRDETLFACLRSPWSLRVIARSRPLTGHDEWRHLLNDDEWRWWSISPWPLTPRIWLNLDKKRAVCLFVCMPLCVCVCVCVVKISILYPLYELLLGYSIMIYMMRKAKIAQFPPVVATLAASPVLLTCVWYRSACSKHLLSIINCVSVNISRSIDIDSKVMEVTRNHSLEVCDKLELKFDVGR